MDALLQDLNPAQQEAVTHRDGPLLVLAGPGSGKTRVITRRMAWLRAQGVPAASMLAITFTNKAAAEMRERLADMVGRSGFWISTFHALGARLLRGFAHAAGLDPGFVIFDTADRRSIIKQVLEGLDIKLESLQPARVEALIGSLKDRLIQPDVYLQQATDDAEQRIARIWLRYEALMRENNALDFDDLIYRLAIVLRDHPDIRESLGQSFRYVLIDEYQDTNHAQYQIARLLTLPHGPSPNLAVTGDPDQSIYAWRGADIGNILSFEADHPEAKVIRLEQNYRSTPQILRVAHALIRNNRLRPDKDLLTANSDGPAVRFEEWESDRAEAARAVQILRAWTAQGQPLREAALFYRTNQIARVLEEALLQARIPYRVARGIEFYNRREIRDLLSYLRLLVNPHDSISLQRCINMPPRKIGRTTLSRLSSAAQQRGCSPLDLCARAPHVPELKTAAKRLADFACIIQCLRESLGLNRGQDHQAAIEGLGGVGPAIQLVLERSGLLQHLRDEDSDGERADNALELVNAAGEYDRQAALEQTRPTLLDWLNQIALVADADRFEGDQDAVSLMTLHAAKGLEFDLVQIVGLEDGLLPHARTLQATTDEPIEEERRLFFVGITRARRMLILSRARQRMRDGILMPVGRSRFIGEIPADLFDVHNQAALQPEPTTAWNYGGQTARPGYSQPSPQAHRRRPASGFSNTPDWARRIAPGLATGRDDLPPAEPDVPDWPPPMADDGTGGSLFTDEPTSSPAASTPARASAAVNDSTLRGYAVGTRVRHAEHGDGSVVSLAAQGERLRISIRFDSGATRSLILPPARLRKI